MFVKRGVPSKKDEKRLKFILADPFEQTSVRQDNMYYEMREIIEVPVNTRRLVSQVKTDFIASLAGTEWAGKFSAPLLRFREKTVDKVTTVYADDEILEKYRMIEGKEIAVQVLSEPERVLPETNLIMV